MSPDEEIKLFLCVVFLFACAMVFSLFLACL